MPEDVLETERAQLQRARADLARMRSNTAALLDGQSGWANDELTARALVAALASRYEQLLDDGVTPLFFGRLDYQEPRESFHIGRRHVTGEDGEPVVVDWRAPIAGAFYRATRTDPMGVSLRRRFGFRDGQLTAYEDDRLDEPQRPSALLVREIEQRRTGPMRDIVASIQPEQDVLVRAPLEETLCVQGAPGTGKTAVGLHRAAYLLYAYRQRLAATGVLVVGPNRAFLSYVQEVLPALGEVRVTQMTVDELAPKATIRRDEVEEVAVLKGDSRLATVLQRALWDHAHRSAEPLVHTAGGRRWRVTPEQCRELERSVRNRGLPWDNSRAALAGALAAALVRQREEAGTAMSDRAVDVLARSSLVRGHVDRLWPTLTPTRLVAPLLSDRAVLACAADGVLSPEEQRLLLWPEPPATPGRAPWSRADLALLDEAAFLLARQPGYAHVVLDEAQDLSAMQLRAVGRRCLTSSATLLGDLAQATSAWAVRDWHQVLAHLGKPAGTVRGLTIGYRVPRTVLDYANRLLPSIAPQLPAPSSLRDVPDALTVRGVATDDLPDEVVKVVALHSAQGSVGVVAGEPWPGRLLRALQVAGIPAELLGDRGPSGGVTVVPAHLVKGLEFDHVLTVEPAELVESGARGRELLYVALTRAVTSLTVLHARPLPDELVTALPAA